MRRRSDYISPRKQELALHRRGFDNSYRTHDRSGIHIHVRCSQCEALVINGVATHELGCPNIKGAR